MGNDIQASLSHEETQREIIRLWKRAEVMRDEELRIALARLADRVAGDANPPPLLLVRGQVAKQIIEARAAKGVKFHKLKRALTIVDSGHQVAESLVYDFCRIWKKP